MSNASEKAPSEILMRATSAGPSGNHIAGSTYKVPGQMSREEAKALVDGHFAVWVGAESDAGAEEKKAVEEDAAESAPEDAEAPAGEETATTRTSKRSRKQ